MQVPTRLVVLLCVSIFAGCSSDKAIIADHSPRPVKVQPVTSYHHSATLTFPSRLLPSQRTQLAFRVPGTVIDIPVVEGQEVEQGELLAHMDPHDFNVLVREWKARYNEARTVLAQAESERKRVIIAMEQDALASVELDRANTGVERAKAGVEVAKQRLQSASDALQYSNLKAPFDGIIAKVKVEPFEQAVPGISVITLYGKQGYEVVFDVPDKLAQQIKPGQVGSIRFQQATGDVWPVKIKEVASAASMLAKTYRVTASLDRVPAFAWPEMTAEVSIDIQTTEQEGILLPATAVVGQGTDAEIVVIDEGIARKITVQVLGFEGDNLRVNGDLKPGMHVAVAGVSFLEDGQIVGQLINLDDRISM